MSRKNIQIKKTIGELIREAREKKGLLLRQLAAFLEMDQAILSKIERGERKATREQILKAAPFLGLNKKNLLIQYLSENIAYDLYEEDVANQALKIAEKKVEYFKKKENGKIIGK